MVFSVFGTSSWSVPWKLERMELIATRSHLTVVADDIFCVMSFTVMIVEKSLETIQDKVIVTTCDLSDSALN